MPLPQDINPIRNFADTLVKASQGEWHETSPGQAWVKTSAQVGVSASLSSVRFNRSFMISCPRRRPT